jgi:folate-binding protein YgfZ
MQEALQKRLQMFVMRAKVKLDNVSASQLVLGFIGAQTMTHVLPWFAQLPASPYELVSNESGTLLRVADADGVARYQWIAEKEVAEQAWATLAGVVAELPEPLWALSEIHAGIPHIGLTTQEKFVPQMINYELIGAVNFKKGCYPGQEIVARTHYLGKQKRRTVLAHVDSANVQSGMEVFVCRDLDLTQPCGMVVNAAANPAGGTDCLIEIKTACYNQNSVQLSTGELCHWLPMPYALPIDQTEDNATS